MTSLLTYRNRDLCKTPPFAQFLCLPCEMRSLFLWGLAQILILKILHVFLWLKFSPSLNLNKIEHVSKVSNQKGLTILEIIVTIVIAAILGTVLVQVMSTSLTRSSVPITRLQNTYSINQIIEEMTADYEELYENVNEKEYDISTLKTYIENGNVSSNTPYYGPYSLDEIDYIRFDASDIQELDPSGDNNILKVSISSNNQSLTVLFTK
jgi:prepilin-type N-terminal cleavage/methylation domain-containing protein